MTNVLRLLARTLVANPAIVPLDSQVAIHFNLELMFVLIEYEWPASSEQISSQLVVILVVLLLSTLRCAALPLLLTREQ